MNKTKPSTKQQPACAVGWRSGLLCGSSNSLLFHHLTCPAKTFTKVDDPQSTSSTIWLCCSFFPTSIRNRSVFIQSHQWRVQQHCVHVLCDHTVVGRLYPRLVFVDCKREGENLLTSSVFRLAAELPTFHRRYKIFTTITSVLFVLDVEKDKSAVRRLFFFSFIVKHRVVIMLPSVIDVSVFCSWQED